jgi:uncharacterized protein (DUF1697 family)
MPFMATHIALLRGINVGGHNKVAMADLRALMTSLGHTDVATYIQSGNAVFTPGSAASPAALASALEEAIAGTLGVRPVVVVLTREDLAETIRNNPYPDEPSPKSVHAVFFREVPGGVTEAIEVAMRRDAERGGHGSATLVGRTLFVHTPAGLGTSELAAHLLARKASPAAVGTARNWATVTKLAALCDN